MPALAWVGAVQAQPSPPVVIGWLASGSQPRGGGLLGAFNEGMAALGWQLGVTYRLEERHADGRAERLPALAQDLAAKTPAVIVAWPSAAVAAATKAAPTTPVVLVSGDPLATGLVTSLARPGGMVTGVSNVSADAINKVLELLVEAMPKLRRVGFLVDSSTPGRNNGPNARRAAEHTRVEAVIAYMAKPDDLEPAFAQLAKGKVQAVVLMPSAWFAAHLPPIIQSASARGWPAVGSIPGIPAQGGLLSYGADPLALARRAAHYVDRILKGAKPGDLPIEQPTVVGMVINMKTARKLGLEIPPMVLLRAMTVIE